MPLTKLQFKPGVNREVTSYSNEGGWRDCDKIRFRFGYPEKMGGWNQLGNINQNELTGAGRGLHHFVSSTSIKFSIKNSFQTIFCLLLKKEY